MDPEKVVRAFLDAFAAFDEEAAIALLEPGVVQHATNGAQPLTGPEEIRSFMRALQSFIDTVEDVTYEIIGTGPFVAVAATSRGRTINAQDVTLRSLTVFKVGRGGKIASIWGFGHPALQTAT